MATATLATTSGGVIFCIAADMSSTVGNTGAFTGTETYTNRNNQIANAGTHTVGDASNVATDAASSITVTYGNSADTTIVAASWR